MKAATYNSAQALRAGDRLGLLRKGYDASVLLLNGNPLKDIAATEQISGVVFKGERVDRPELFKQ